VRPGDQVRRHHPEACLSIPGLSACCLRAMTTVVTGVDRRGDPVSLTGTGELSRVLQHETDHLRGVLFIERLTGQGRKDALRELRGVTGPVSGAAG
jgi:peptide deformylase